MQHSRVWFMGYFVLVVNNTSRSIEVQLEQQVPLAAFAARKLRAAVGMGGGDVEVGRERVSHPALIGGIKPC
jgi:hypothetical protein